MKRLFILSILIFPFYLIVSPAFASVTHDMAVTTNYNIRIDGAAQNDNLSYFYIESVDLNNDGENDLIIDAAGKNGMLGSVYIIFGNLLRDITGKGQTIDLNNPDNYSLRYDGVSPYTTLGFSGNYTGDIDNDGKADLVLNSFGAVYVVYNTLLNSQATSGKNYSFSTSTNYSIRFNTTSATALAYSTMRIEDINGDNKDDLILPAPGADYNTKTNSGSFFVILNDLISVYPGPGRNIDLDTSANYTYRFDGSTANNLFSFDYVEVCDINNNGFPDIMVPERYTDYNNRGDSGSLYVIYDSVFHSFSGPGKNFLMSDASNYSLRFDGAGINNQIGSTSSIACADLDNDNKSDVVFGVINATNNGLSKSGSAYVLYNSLISNLSGKTFDLLSSDYYSIRFDGSAVDEWIGDYGISVADSNNDGKNDLFISSFNANNGSDLGTGRTYIIYNDHLSSYSSKNVDFATTTNYDIRYYGSAGSRLNHWSYQPNDLNGDGSPDLLLGAWPADFNTRPNSGSVYIIYNFPHAITVASVSSPTNDNTPTITGSVSAPNSVTNISGVQYQVDSNTIAGTWTACSATDGSFNSTSESFNCSVPALTDGNHTIYIRSYDANTVYTAQSEYASISVTTDITEPNGFTWQTLSRSLKSGNDMINTVADGGFTSDHKVALSWEKEGDATSGIESYRVYYREKGDSKWKLIAEVDADTDFVWVDEDPGEYEWYVKAIDYAGNETDSKIFTFTIVVTPDGAPTVNLVNGVAPVSGNVHLANSDILTVEGTADNESGVVVAIYDLLGQTKYQEILCNSDSAGFFTCTDPALMNSSYLLKIFSRNEVGDEGPVTQIMINGSLASYSSILSEPTGSAPSVSVVQGTTTTELAPGIVRGGVAINNYGIVSGAVDFPEPKLAPEPPRQNILQRVWYSIFK